MVHLKPSRYLPMVESPRGLMHPLGPPSEPNSGVGVSTAVKQTRSIHIRGDVTLVSTIQPTRKGL